MINRWYFVFISTIIFISSTLWHCSPGNGSGTGVGNGMIQGKLFSPDGKTPAYSAIVKIWRKDTIIDFTAGSAGTAQPPAYTAVTDKEGVFSIETVDTGLYLLEGSDNEQNMVLVDSIYIESAESRLTLPPDTLKASGAISGTIVLENGGSPQEIFILCFGNSRFTQLDNDGTFLLSPLAEGEYILRVLPITGRYPSVVTGTIPVISDSTTNLDTIFLESNNSTVEGLRVTSYDSLLQIVYLSWNAIASTTVKGYKLYRREVDTGSFQEPIGGSFFLRDTVYNDSDVVQDITYEYSVTAIDSNDNESPLSKSVIHTAFGAHYLQDSMQLSLYDSSDIVTFVTSRRTDCFYLVREKTEGSQSGQSLLVEKYTADGTPVTSWPLPDSVGPVHDSWPPTFPTYPIIIDSADNIYYAVYSVTEDDTLYSLCCMTADGASRLLFTEESGFKFEVVNNAILYVVDTITGYYSFDDREIKSVNLNKYILTDDTTVRIADPSHLIDCDRIALFYDSKGTVNVFAGGWIDTSFLQGCENCVWIDWLVDYDGISDSIYIRIWKDHERSALSAEPIYEFRIYRFQPNQQKYYEDYYLHRFYRSVKSVYMACNGDVYYLDGFGVIRRLSFPIANK